MDSVHRVVVSLSEGHGSVGCALKDGRDFGQAGATQTDFLMEKHLHDTVHCTDIAANSAQS